MMRFLLALPFLFLSRAVMAATACTGASIFEPCHPEQDQAWQWLDFLFLGKQIVDSTGFPIPQATVLQDAMRAALGFYSTGMLAVAGVILLYHLMVMVAETAHSGKPMGRANQVWAPIRLVVCIGLLVPIGGSLNSGQYALIHMAKWGSGLASQTWNIFLTQLAGSEVPKMPEKPAPLVAKVALDLTLMKACMEVYNYSVNARFNADYSPELIKYNGVSLYLPSGSNAGEFRNNRDGAVCGSFSVPQTTTGTAQQVELIQKVYLANQQAFVDFMGDSKVDEVAKKILAYVDPQSGEIKPTAADLKAVTDSYYTRLAAALDSVAGYNALNTTVKQIAERWQKDGWVAAGAWWNTIARVQSNVLDSYQDALPNTNPPDLYFYKKQLAKAQADYQDRPQSVTSNDALHYASDTLLYGNYHETISNVLIQYSDDMQGGGKAPSDLQVAMSGTTVSSGQDGNKHPWILKVFDIVEWLGQYLGVWPKDGNLLFELKTANPLSELAAIGHNNMALGLYLIEWGIGVKLGSFLAEYTGDKLAAKSPAAVFGKVLENGGQIAAPLGAVFLVIGGVFCAAGALLLYFLPMLCFIRFFFAVVIWLFVVFEGVVSAPLFALAHLNPHGDDLPGPNAKKGYQFLLSILLRPILMLFGLIAGLLLFEVAVFFLNKMFLIASYGTGSYSGGLATLSKMIFSLMYVFLAYICANTCFRTITHFPDHALNWMGASGPATRDIGDPAQVASIVTAGSDYLISKSVIQPMAGAVDAYTKEGREGISARKKARALETYKEKLKGGGKEENKGPEVNSSLLPNVSDAGHTGPEDKNEIQPAAQKTEPNPATEKTSAAKQQNEKQLPPEQKK